jgi:limonene-1,2-epoxide hydrolase
MKYFYLLLFIFSCQACLSQTTESEKIVGRFFNAVNAHDTIAIAQLFSANSKGESPNWGSVQTGGNAIAHEFARNFAGDSILKFNIINMIDAKNSVIAEYNFSGRISSTAKEVPAYMHGKDYDFKACSIFSLSNEKITAIRTYFDQVAFLKQMGFFQHQ